MLLINKQIKTEVLDERPTLRELRDSQTAMMHDLVVDVVPGTGAEWIGERAAWCKETLFVVNDNCPAFLKRMVNKKSEGLITKLCMSIQGLHIGRYYEDHTYDSDYTNSESGESAYIEDALDNTAKGIITLEDNQQSYSDDTGPDTDNPPEASESEDEDSTNSEYGSEPEDEEDDDDNEDDESDSDSENSDSHYFCDWNMLRHRLLLHPLQCIYLRLDESPSKLPWKLLEFLHDSRVPAVSFLYRRSADGSVPAYRGVINDTLGSGSEDEAMFEPWFSIYGGSFLVKEETTLPGRCFFNLEGAEVMATFTRKE